MLPGKGPTFNTDYLPIFLNIIVEFRCGARVQRCDLLVTCVLLIHAGRRKNGLPLVADDKGKATKKKNLQVTAMLTLRLPIAKFHL